METTQLPQDLERINGKIKKLATFLNNEDLLVKNNNITEMLKKFMNLKQIIGNLDMDIHFLASHIANSFLEKKHGITIDLTKPGGSAGFDIKTEQVVGEIKTTIPYNKNDFGANQKKTIQKDLRRLEESDREFKYFFVTNQKTEQILIEKYSRKYPSVKIANLFSKLD